jgi:WD40 repeat protein
MVVDASNACIPPSSPLVQSIPPLPSATRGEQCVLDGLTGRINEGKALLAYGSGRMVVVRSLGEESNHVPLVYRGHSNAVTAVKFSLSGSYVASGDARGKLRVWAFDHEEHLPKLDNHFLTGPIRDISWDMESKRVSHGGTCYRIHQQLTLTLPFLILFTDCFRWRTIRRFLRLHWSYPMGHRRDMWDLSPACSW